MAFPSDLEDLLDEGNFVLRSLVRADLGSGPFGMWNGLGTLTWDGVDYIQNSLLKINEPPFVTGTTANEFSIEMPESADFGITPDVLAEIDTEDYKNKTIRIYDAYFHPETMELLHVEPMLYGYIDTIDHIFEEGQWKLRGNLESRAVDNHRDGYRAANHEDQQLVYEGDDFFEYAGIVKHQYFDISFGED